MFYRRTPPIPGEKSIASLEFVEINGIKQALLIRGENRENPLLLFLHGGPGTAQIALARKHLRELERDFVVVNWDQRGSGLSYSAEVPKESMNVEQFIDDTRALTELLLSRFEQTRLFLVGHSWGSVLGTLTAARYPHLFHAYVGLGQVTSMADNEAVSYRYTLDVAKQQNNLRALRDLERIGPPPYVGTKPLEVQRKWLARFGGVIRKGNLFRFVLESLVLSKEYALTDMVGWAKGGKFSQTHMWDELMTVNLPAQVPELAVPTYFVLGRYDYNTPSELAVRYFEQLRAPSKELIWFEESAHGLFFEEPQKFASTMRNVLGTHRSNPLQ